LLFAQARIGGKGGSDGEDKQRWGYKFRFGVFKIDDHDLDLIRRAMTG
jgi:hypothetical protein